MAYGAPCGGRALRAPCGASSTRYVSLRGLTADRDEAEQPKRKPKRMRIRNGKSGDARRRNDD
eukprot:6380136-Prymnesium_polylepis.1